MSFCSPRQILSKKKTSKKSCYNDETIDKIVDLYNSAGKTHIKKTDKSEDKLKKIMDELGSEMPCDKEYCLAYSKTMNSMKKELLENFRPQVPEEWKKNKKTWLNTNDILNAMNQYQLAFDDFKFLSVSPIDFDTRLNENGEEVKKGGVCVDRSLCAINLENLLHSSITRIGAIFNLDKHNESGSHWTAMFSDFLLGEFYYYDSVANLIPDEITDLAQKVVSQGNALVVSGKHDISTSDRLHVINDQITVQQICDFFMKNNNFILYRYAYLFPAEKKFNINTTVPEAVAAKIVGDVLNLIDKTEQERYASIDNLQELSKHVRGNRVSIDDFVFDWVNENLTIAINNLMDSLKVLETPNDGGIRTTVADIEYNEKNHTFHIITANPNVSKKQSMTDVSFKAYSNFIQHQFRNTECGMYSINFIDNFLFKNKTFIEIINDPINDETMNEMRYTKYFLSI